MGALVVVSRRFLSATGSELALKQTGVTTRRARSWWCAAGLHDRIGRRPSTAIGRSDAALSILAVVAAFGLSVVTLHKWTVE
jgi:hypothetical protein